MLVVCSWYVHEMIVVSPRDLFVIHIQVKKREQLDLMAKLRLPHLT